jgi:hypothetical protein
MSNSTSHLACALHATNDHHRSKNKLRRIVAGRLDWTTKGAGAS